MAATTTTRPVGREIRTSNQPTNHNNKKQQTSTQNQIY
jgi:hypothetical protein